MSEEFETPDVNEVANARFAEPIVEVSKLLSSESIAAVTNADIDLPPSGKSKRRTRIAGEPKDETVPRWERWEIRYDSATLASYAKQLDFFKIELGAAGGGSREVDYLTKVSSSAPVSRAAPGLNETRLYMVWRGGRLQDLDRQLLTKAGVKTNGRILMQFYPKKVENELAALERKHRKDGRIDKIKKTIFGVRPNEAGYEFYIIEQT